MQTSKDPTATCGFVKDKSHDMSSAAANAGTEGDLGAIDEVKSFHHEGDGEENLSSLNDLKQDLEQEADTDKAKVRNSEKMIEWTLN